MITQQLLDYIKQQIASGISKENIGKALKTSGWNDIDIAQALDVNQVVALNSSPNKQDWTKYYNQKMATTGLIISIISLFIIPGVAISSITMGIMGIYCCIKNKLGWKVIITSILAIIIGFVSLLLKAIVSKK